MMKRLMKFLEKNEILILILLGVAVLRLPTLYEPNRYADEDIYLTLGQAVRRGWVLYRDIHDNKPPLLYLVAALAGGVMWFRFFLLLWNLINTVVVWKIARLLLTKKSWAMVATGLFAFFSTIPLTEGNIANGEVFMIMPVALAVYLWLKTEKGKAKPGTFLLIGTLFAAGFLFKVPVVFDLAGVMFWWIFYRTIKWRRILFIWLGFIGPVLASILYYTVVGAGGVYVRSALMQNVGYLSSWEGGGRPFYESGLFIRGIVLMAVMALIFLNRKHLGERFGLAGLWFAFALFGALLSGRPYPHYLIQIVTPAALLLSILGEERDWRRLIVGGALLGLAGGALFYYRFWYYKSLPYYRNFVEYTLLGKPKEEYWRFWGNGVGRDMEVARFIKQTTGPAEKIFVWGTEPAIYALAERSPAVKYVVSYHINEFGARDEVGEALAREKPRVMVVMDDEKESFPALIKLLATEYLLVKRVDGARVYWRLNNLY